MLSLPSHYAYQYDNNNYWENIVVISLYGYDIVSELVLIFLLKVNKNNKLFNIIHGEYLPTMENVISCCLNCSDNY